MLLGCLEKVAKPLALKNKLLKFTKGLKNSSLGLFLYELKYNLKESTGDFYHRKFYDSRLWMIEKSAPPVVDSLVKFYNPNFILDCGCGSGEYLSEFKKRGVKVIGYDYSKEAIRRCINRGINAKRFDIRKDWIDLEEKVDLCICFEVAEHLPISISTNLAGGLHGLKGTL